MARISNVPETGLAPTRCQAITRTHHKPIMTLTNDAVGLSAFSNMNQIDNTHGHVRFSIISYNIEDVGGPT